MVVELEVNFCVNSFVLIVNRQRNKEALGATEGLRFKAGEPERALCEGASILCKNVSKYSMAVFSSLPGVENPPSFSAI